MSCYYMFFSTFPIFWTNLQPIQASEGGSTTFLHMQSQFKQKAPKMFGPIWSLYLVVLVCSQTFLVTHECMHIHIKKTLSFSTEINVYSIPNVLCMRQYVWSRLYLAWGLRLRCFCGETDRQGEREMAVGAMNRGTPTLIWKGEVNK